MGLTARDKIDRALRAAVTAFNECRDPDTACVKAAEAQDLTAEQTERLVEKFNAARVITHFKSASDRTAAVSLASKADVVTGVFSPAVKKAAAPAFDDAGRAYAEPDRDYTKAAAAPLPEPEYVPERTFDWLAERMHAEVGRMKTAADSAFSEAASLELRAERLATAAAEMADERGYAMMKSAGDADGYAKMEALVGRPPEEKLAAHIAKLPFFDTAPVFLPLAKLAEAGDMLRKAAALRKQAEEGVREADAYMSEFEDLIYGKRAAAPAESPADMLKTAGPGAFAASGNVGAEPLQTGQDMTERKSKPKSRGAGGGSDDDDDGKDTKGGGKGGDKKKPLASVADTVSDGTIGGLGDLFGFARDTAVKPALSSMTVNVDRALGRDRADELAAMSANITNTRRQLMLQELMVTDPVLADADPDQVANAYATLLTMSPEVASQKEIVRSVLRQMVNAEGVSPFDAAVFTKLESSLSNVGRPAPRGGQDGK